MSNVSEQVQRFAARISRVRKARGMSQQDLADATGLTRQAIGKMEAGQQGIGLDDALALCAALDVPLLDMLSDGRLSLSVQVPID